MTELSSSNITLPSPQMSTTDLDINQTNMELSWLQRLRKNFPSYLVAVDYLLLLALAESLIALEVPQPGLLMHGVILATLLLHASLVKRVDERRFLLAMALAPLLPASMTLPLALFQVTFWYAVIGVPLLIASLLVARIAGITRSMAGLTLRALPEQILIGLSGFALGYLEYLILRPTPLVASLSWTPLAASPHSACVHWFPGRAYLSRLAPSRCPAALGAFWHALCSCHLRSTAPGLPISARYSVRLRRGIDIWIDRTPERYDLGASLAHGLTNVALYLVFPFILTQPVVQLGTLSKILPTKPCSAAYKSSAFS